MPPSARGELDRRDRRRALRFAAGGPGLGGAGGCRGEDAAGVAPADRSGGPARRDRDRRELGRAQASRCGRPAPATACADLLAPPAFAAPGEQLEEARGDSGVVDARLLPEALEGILAVSTGQFEEARLGHANPSPKGNSSIARGTNTGIETRPHCPKRRALPCRGERAGAVTAMERERMDVSVEIHCEACGSANYSLRGRRRGRRGDPLQRLRRRSGQRSAS